MWLTLIEGAIGLAKVLCGIFAKSRDEKMGNLETENAVLKKELSDVEKANIAAGSVGPNDSLRNDPNNRDAAK